MDADDREDPGGHSVRVPVILVDALSSVMVDILDGYYESIGLDEIDLTFCQAAIAAAMSLAMDQISGGGDYAVMH